MIDETVKKKIINSTRKTFDDFMTMPLEGNMGYKFQTRAFMEIVFLYKNGVDAKNPDLLGRNNKNTFVDEAQSEIEKIKEQVRIDLFNIGFLVPGASTLGRYVPKAANRKVLEDNDFAETLDQVPDDSIDYGSGFLTAWRSGKDMKLACVDPFDMIFNQRDFAGGLKIQRLKKKRSWIIDNKKYDTIARAKLKGETKEDELENDMVILQVVEDLANGGQRLSIVDLERDEVFYDYTSSKKIIWFFKFDCEKRRGFKDALGRGKYERVFNKLVQSKVNRERMDEVMAVASKLPFQKEMDNERDNWAGKEVVKMKTSAIIGHKGKPISVLDTGGVKQANIINQQLGAIIQSIGDDLNVGDALQGKTLPAGTSGALGNLLTENQSSVHKEIQKKYGNWLGIVYKTCLTPYILEVFDSADNLKDFLDPNDIKMVEINVINYLVAQKQVDAAINDEPFDIGVATEEVKREIKNKPLISGELLDSLRSEVQNIRTYISGETMNKAKTVAYIREIRAEYKQNPEIFKDPAYVAMLKKEAEYDVGLDPLELENLLSEIQ